MQIALTWLIMVAALSRAVGALRCDAIAMIVARLAAHADWRQADQSRHVMSCHVTSHHVIMSCNDECTACRIDTTENWCICAAFRKLVDARRVERRELRRCTPGALRPPTRLTLLLAAAATGVAISTPALQSIASFKSTKLPLPLVPTALNMCFFEFARYPTMSYVWEAFSFETVLCSSSKLSHLFFSTIGTCLAKLREHKKAQVRGKQA